MLPSSPDIFNIPLSGTQVGKLNWLGLSGGTKDQYKINKDYFEFNWRQSKAYVYLTVLKLIWMFNISVFFHCSVRPYQMHSLCIKAVWTGEFILKLAKLTQV